MLKGVYKAVKKDKTIYFRASITYRGKHISLGSFDTENRAGEAYDEADAILGTQETGIAQYSKDAALSFEKWVILINFRDNGIYFGTPIYARAKSKFFYYYISPHYVLKFDIDDLFYYSSHKIMKRGGHLFVADYGMQINILSRYGIRSFAVPGKDYLFINGDDTDYRHENLKIINPYQGVSEVRVGDGIRYKSRINLPGYYTIGCYSSLEEAAIAYNKAIDILRKNGVDRAYTPNYVEGVTPSQYAEIYTHVRVSEKILNYRQL